MTRILWEKGGNIFRRIAGVRWKGGGGMEGTEESDGNDTAGGDGGDTVAHLKN